MMVVVDVPDRACGDFVIPTSVGHLPLTDVMKVIIDVGEIIIDLAGMEVIILCIPVAAVLEVIVTCVLEVIILCILGNALVRLDVGVVGHGRRAVRGMLCIECSPSERLRGAGCRRP